MQTHSRFFPLLLLIAFLGVYLSCSKQSSTNEAVSTGGNPAANPSSSASPIVEMEPVMPEKVQVAFEQNCKSCHGPDGHGITSVAPDLRRAARRNLKEWVSYLKDPKGAHAEAKIPAMASLTDDDYEAIGGYLADLTQNNPAAADAKK